MWPWPLLTQSPNRGREVRFQQCLFSPGTIASIAFLARHVKFFEAFSASGFAKDALAAKLLLQVDKVAQPLPVDILAVPGVFSSLFSLKRISQGEQHVVANPFREAFASQHCLLLWRVICLPGMGIFVRQCANEYRAR